jgi:hypothetical protein
MNDKVIKLRLPYEAKFIPYRHRNFEVEYFWSEGHVAIRTVPVEAIEVSHRIFGADKKLEVEVRRFESKYWWPLKLAQRPISVEKLASLAEKGDHSALAVLGCGIRGFHWAEPEEELFRRKPRIISTTRDEQWTKAQAGASRIILCDATLFLEVGPPIYYGYRSPDTPKFALDVFAGPSADDRLDGDPIRIDGLKSSRRNYAAAAAQAFGVEEFARESRWLRREAGSFRMVNRIEELLPPTPQLGADTCMRALAAVLWRRTRDDGDWDTWPWIRRYVPALAKADGRLPYPADLSARQILEELVSADLGGFSKQFSGTVSIAQEILRRLDFTGHPVLSDDDEQALTVIGASI